MDKGNAHQRKSIIIRTQNEFGLCFSHNKTALVCGNKSYQRKCLANPISTTNIKVVFHLISFVPSNLHKLFLTFALNHLHQIVVEGTVPDCVEHQVVGVEIDAVIWLGELKWNFKDEYYVSGAFISSTYSSSDALCCTNFTQLEVAGIEWNGLTELLCCSGFTLSLDNLLLALLSCTFDVKCGSRSFTRLLVMAQIYHNVNSPLSFLLRDLLALNSSSVFLAKTHVSERNIVKNDIEVSGSLDQLTTDEKWYLKHQISQVKHKLHPL